MEQSHAHFYDAIHTVIVAGDFVETAGVVDSGIPGGSGPQFPLEEGKGGEKDKLPANKHRELTMFCSVLVMGKLIMVSGFSPNRLPVVTAPSGSSSQGVTRSS